MLSRTLQFQFLASLLLIAGCNQPTVTVKPEEGGILPPPNPPAIASTEKLPTAIKAGGKPWLDTSKLPIETWYSLYINGRCIGFSQLTIEASKLDGAKLLSLTKRDVLEIPATSSQPIQRREIVLESFERPNGELLNFTEITSDNGEDPKEATAKVQGEILSATRVVDGKPQGLSLTWPQGTWGPFGVVSMLRQQAMQPEEKIVGQVFFPQVSKLTKVELKCGSKVWTTLPGSGAVELLPIETTMELDGSKAVSKNWVNEAGEIMKSISQDGLTMFRTTKADAERIDSEIRAGQLIASKIPISVTAEQLMTPQITFTIDSENVDPFTVLSSKSNQEIKSLSARGAELTIARITPSDEPIAQFIHDLPTPDHSQPLDADSPQLKRFLANQKSKAEPGDETPLAVSKKLTEAVFRELAKVANSREFLTPTETLLKKSGDSKAHSLLLIAALRQSNIPARAASGLRIVKAGDSIVGIYHMWCEAWLNERWMPLDPFVGSIGVGVDHIKFLESSLNEPNRNSAMLPVLTTMNQLTITANP